MNTSLHSNAKRLFASMFLVAVVATACGSNADDSAKQDPDTKAALTISDVWARPALADGNTAIYMKIAGGDTADAMVKASLPSGFAATVEMHETTMAGGGSGMSSTTAGGGHGADMPATTADGGHGSAMNATTAPSDDMNGQTSTTKPPMRSMHPVEKIAIPANGTVELAPGGIHIMVMKLAKPLAVGDTFTATLTFEHAGDKQVTVTVKES